MSLFSGLIRSTDMIGSLHMTWETSVGVESEIAQLRRGEGLRDGQDHESSRQARDYSDRAEPNCAAEVKR
jgi:hypothetical protein